MLARNGPMTAGRLAEMTGLTTGAITGLVDRLERRGYARREHPTDRRSILAPAPDRERRTRLRPSLRTMSEAMDELMSRYDVMRTRQPSSISRPAPRA